MKIRSEFDSGSASSWHELSVEKILKMAGAGMKDLPYILIYSLEDSYHRAPTKTWTFVDFAEAIAKAQERRGKPLTKNQKLELTTLDESFSRFEISAKKAELLVERHNKR